MITLVTVTQSNPVALRRTVDNVRAAFGGLANEFVVGDVSVFDDYFGSGFEDVRFHKLPFDTLYKDGFAATLNHLSTKATNDLCLYLNVGEIVEHGPRRELLSDSYNCYSFNHATDPHIWIRMWDRRTLCWSGRIHEEVVGRKNLCPRHLFRMADTPKDNDDELRAGIYNDIKELVYFKQYVHIAEHPEDLAATGAGWLDYSIQELDDLKRRLREKGDRYRAFEEGDLAMYLEAAKMDKPPSEWSKP